MPEPALFPTPGTGLISAAEFELIRKVLRECGGNKTAAAKKLGISPPDSAQEAQTYGGWGMILSGRVSDAGLMARLRAGEELELAGAFSEGIYFTGPGGMVMLHDTRYGCLPFGIAIPGFSGLSRAGRCKLRGAGLAPPGRAYFRRARGFVFTQISSLFPPPPPYARRSKIWRA